MADCKTCDFENICEMPDFVRNNLKDCKVYEPKKKQTNADRLRAMSDEELAEFLEGINRDYDISYGDYFSTKKGDFVFGKNDFDKQLLKWLQSEAEEPHD